MKESTSNPAFHVPVLTDDMRYYFSVIGSKGGRRKSARKRAAGLRNIEKANRARGIGKS